MHERGDAEAARRHDLALALRQRRGRRAPGRPARCRTARVSWPIPSRISSLQSPGAAANSCWCGATSPPARPPRPRRRRAGRPSRAASSAPIRSATRSAGATLVSRQVSLCSRSSRAVSGRSMAHDELGGERDVRASRAGRRGSGGSASRSRGGPSRGSAAGWWSAADRRAPTRGCCRSRRPTGRRARRTPSSRATSIVAIADVSLAANMAVGGSSPVSSSRAASADTGAL